MQGKYGNLDASVVSYGPCQTPTLNFCVERHQKISSFQPEPFWVVRPHVSKGGQSITLEWGRGRLFDMDVAQMFKKVVADGQQLKVYSAWVSLPVAACCCSLLPIAAHCCPLLPIAAHCCPLLLIAAHCYPEWFSSEEHELLCKLSVAVDSLTQARVLRQ